MTASSQSRDRVIVAVVLRGPVGVVSKSAVVAFVDGMAMKASGPAEFRQWPAGLLPALAPVPTHEVRRGPR
ncbi:MULTISPECIES: hypothetical protein [unclassified Streptomyces]|uniref:hypothetical protein n=1 Tax=unclassified Streptomyces TaxID=2593676 RepID=UPI00332BFB6B